jgi:rhamnose transport system ATP-binding protein
MTAQSVEGPPCARIERISKSYGGVKAVENLSLGFQAGSVHALVGENGAGKSTIVKMLTGVVTPDSGMMYLDEQPVRISDPVQARRLGIAAMYQDPTVFLDQSVEENIFAGRHPRNAIRLVAWGELRRQVTSYLRDLNVDFTPETTVRALGVADRQLVEIAKALSSNAKLIIMDEPTAALSPNEVSKLFGIVRTLRASGKAIIFISHRLNEVKDIADTISVLRDGRLIETRASDDMTTDDMITLMVGRELKSERPRTTGVAGEEALRVDGLTRLGAFADVSFAVHKGEILGISGFVGAGRSEVARVIFGLDQPDAGSLWIDGKPFRPRSPRQALARGLAYAPEDRLTLGLVQTMSVATNIGSSIIPRTAAWGFLGRGKERELARGFIKRLGIRTFSPTVATNTLSGGNQQKVMLSKWLAADPQILILDEPTHGVDVRTKAEVHNIVIELASQGLAIVLITSELPELLGLSDRVVVMHEGRITGRFDRSEATEERVTNASAGLVG